MLVSLIAALFFSLIAPSALDAHASLVKSVPAQRSVLLRAPAKIQLWFSERLEPRYSWFTVSQENGQPIENLKGQVDSSDAKLLTAALTALPAGRYLVKYRVLSVDGHMVEDQFVFTVRP